MRLAALFVLALSCMGQFGGMFPGPGTPHSSGASTPITIFGANLVFWASGDGSGNVCTGGCSGTNAVTTFADRSGNSNNLTCSGDVHYVASAVNSLPGIVGGTSAVCTFGTSINLTSGLSVFVVAKSAASTNSGVVNGNSGAYVFIVQSSLGFKEQNCGIAFVLNCGNANAAADTNWHQINQTYDNTTVIYRIDGASDGSAVISTAITSNETKLNFDGASPSLYIEEVFVVNTVASGGQITAAETYLHTRTGL